MLGTRQVCRWNPSKKLLESDSEVIPKSKISNHRPQLPSAPEENKVFPRIHELRAGEKCGIRVYSFTGRT